MWVTSHENIHFALWRKCRHRRVAKAANVHVALKLRVGPADSPEVAVRPVFVLISHLAQCLDVRIAARCLGVQDVRQERNKAQLLGSLIRVSCAVLPEDSWTDELVNLLHPQALRILGFRGRRVHL